MSSIEERMNLIEENVRRLKGQDVDEDDFYHFQGIKHTLQESVEACIDIASRMISAEGWGRGDDYRDYFQTLVDEEVLDEDLGEEMKKMAGFRNIVVHRYMEVDEKELQKIIDEDLGDILDFIQQVDRFRNK